MERTQESGLVVLEVLKWPIVHSGLLCLLKVGGATADQRRPGGVRLAQKRLYQTMVRLWRYVFVLYMCYAVLVTSDEYSFLHELADANSPLTPASSCRYDSSLGNP